MELRPLNDRVLVRRLEEEKKTAGGIIIPDNQKEKPAQGEVIAAGTGHRNNNGEVTALAVKAGDKIIFSKYAGTEVKLDGSDYLVMKEDDILGILQ
jgi:chaperonin GroES